MCVSGPSKPNNRGVALSAPVFWNVRFGMTGLLHTLSRAGFVPRCDMAGRMQRLQRLGAELDRGMLEISVVRGGEVESVLREPDRDT